MKVTQYFIHTRSRPDRAMIQDEWVQIAIIKPDKTEIQTDGRIRHWAGIPEMDNRIFRVILPSDGEIIHNAFFDRTASI